MIQLQSLTQISALATELPRPDNTARISAGTRQETLTKPPGSLGRLEELAIFMAGWQGTANPSIEHAQALVFAGNHGICDQGVNAYPPAVTAQMVANFQAGGAAINQICQTAGAELSVIAIDLKHPTLDFTRHSALTEQQLLSSINRGMAALDTRTSILILGEMGIGNSTVAAALCAALYGGSVASWVGPGSGADAAGRARKAAAIEAGLNRHAACRGNPLAILQAYGGHEQAAICGAILAARLQRTPVILDGFICTAAATVMHAINPDLLAHCLVGHRSQEPGHDLLLERIGQRPLLDFSMHLGEGTGAALALPIVRAALACHNGMATFAAAGISTS